MLGVKCFSWLESNMYSLAGACVNSVMDQFAEDRQVTFKPLIAELLAPVSGGFKGQSAQRATYLSICHKQKAFNCYEKYWLAVNL